jgi:acyl-CoA dehydrogenase
MGTGSASTRQCARAIVEHPGRDRPGTLDLRRPRHAAAIAKLHGANMANRVSDRVVQIHGGMGGTRDLSIEHWYREMRIWRIFEGTDEIQRLIIARDLLRGYTKIGELL